MKTKLAWLLTLSVVSLLKPAYADDWRPVERARLGTPAPLTSAPRGICIQQPRVIRAKFDIPVAAPDGDVIELQRVQIEPPEPQLPQIETIPSMPKLDTMLPKTERIPLRPKLESKPAAKDAPPFPGDSSASAPSVLGSAIFSADAVLLGDGLCDSCACNQNACCFNDCCCTNCCCNCCCCDGRPAVWLGAEYLLWRFNGQTVPPLVTTSAQADNGILGAPSTHVLYGPNQLNSDPWHSGARLFGGFWFSENPCWGMDASGFIVGRDTNSTGFASGGDPLLARPFQMVGGGQSANIVATTNLIPPNDPNAQAVSGSVIVRSNTLLWGYDLNLRRKWLNSQNFQADLLAGYRQLRLDEGIEIDDYELGMKDLINRNVFDRFHTRNAFFGGQIGVDGEYRFAARWSLGSTVKVAFGSMNEAVQINGYTQFSGPNVVPVTRPGGMLALNSNIGLHQRQTFAVVPEVQLKLRYQLNDNWSVFAGYNLLVLSNVVRPGQQIDTTLDPAQFPDMAGNGAAGTRPAVLLHNGSFVAQGVNVGLLCNY